MNKLWARSTLQYVNTWACEPGRPEDKEDGANGTEGVVYNKAGDQHRGPNSSRELNTKFLRDTV